MDCKDECSIERAVDDHPLNQPTRGPPVDEGNWKPFDLYVGRECRRLGLAQSPFANPYNMRKGWSRMEALKKFRDHLNASPELWQDLDKLSGMRLRCHCPKEKECHIDEIRIAWAEKRQTNWKKMKNELSGAQDGESIENPMAPRNPQVAAPTAALDQTFTAPLHKSMLKQALVIEIFCGHAGVSTACKERGARILAVDWSGNRHRAGVPIMNLDLTSSEGQAKLLSIIEEEEILFVWMAPPCGTFSRARERPLPAWARGEGIK